MKIRAEINGIETNKTIEMINKTKSWFVEMIKSIHLKTDLTKNRERAQINKIRKKKKL